MGSNKCENWHHEREMEGMGRGGKRKTVHLLWFFQVSETPTETRLSTKQIFLTELKSPWKILVLSMMVFMTQKAVRTGDLLQQSALPSQKGRNMLVSGWCHVGLTAAQGSEA